MTAGGALMSTHIIAFQLQSLKIFNLTFLVAVWHLFESFNKKFCIFIIQNDIKLALKMMQQLKRRNNNSNKRIKSLI